MSAVRRTVSKSSLTILERAFRGALEEQYGHILWLTRIMKAMGAPTALLLKGDAISYARRGQQRLALTIGDVTVSDLSHHESGVQALLDAGVPVHVWAPDLPRLGLQVEQLTTGVVLLDGVGMPALINRFDCVWYW